MRVTVSDLNSLAAGLVQGAVSDLNSLAAGLAWGAGLDFNSLEIVSLMVSSISQTCVFFIMFLPI